jgi:hypothetical protein
MSWLSPSRVFAARFGAVRRGYFDNVGIMRAGRGARNGDRIRLLRPVVTGRRDRRPPIVTFALQLPDLRSSHERRRVEGALTESEWWRVESGSWRVAVGRTEGGRQERRRPRCIGVVRGARMAWVGVTGQPPRVRAVADARRRSGQPDRPASTRPRRGRPRGGTTVNLTGQPPSVRAVDGAWRRNGRPDPPAAKPAARRPRRPQAHGADR